MKRILFILFGIVPFLCLGQAADSVGVNDEVYDHVEDMPEYPGGNSELLNYLSRNISFPESTNDSIRPSSRIYLSLVIDTLGVVSDVTFLRADGYSEEYLNEIREIVLRMPSWKPGYQKGVPVRTRFTIPINICYR